MAGPDSEWRLEPRHHGAYAARPAFTAQHCRRGDGLRRAHGDALVSPDVTRGSPPRRVAALSRRRVSLGFRAARGRSPLAGPHPRRGVAVSLRRVFRTHGGGARGAGLFRPRGGAANGAPSHPLGRDRAARLLSAARHVPDGTCAAHRRSGFGRTGSLRDAAQPERDRRIFGCQCRYALADHVSAARRRPSHSTRPSYRLCQRPGGAGRPVTRIAGADVVVRRHGAGASRPLRGFRTAWIDPAALLVIAIFVAVAVLVRNVLH